MGKTEYFDIRLKLFSENEKPPPEDYENLKDDEQFKTLKSLISKDPNDHLDIVFVNLLDSYVRYKTELNAQLARIKKQPVSEDWITIFDELIEYP